LRAVSLIPLRAVNPIKADAFRVLVVQDFEGVTVEDGDDGSEKSAARERLAASTQPRAMTKWVCRNGALSGNPCSPRRRRRW